jgi:hypothetical protein
MATMKSIADKPLVLFTAADAEIVLGRPITDDEYRNLVKVLAVSCLSGIFLELVMEVCGDGIEDDHG